MKMKLFKSASNITLASSLSIALLLGCAAQQSAPVATQSQEIQPIATPSESQNETDEQIIMNDDLTASELLEVALGFLKSGRGAIAAEAFSRAIATGYLSDAGRSLAYWYIHLAHKSQGNHDESIDALSSFVILAEDLM